MGSFCLAVFMENKTEAQRSVIYQCPKLGSDTVQLELSLSQKILQVNTSTHIYTCMHAYTHIRDIHTHVHTHRSCNSFSNITRQLTQISVDTDWASYNVTQFRHCLLGDSVAFHGLRLQSSKTVLSPFQMSITSPGCLLGI